MEPTQDQVNQAYEPLKQELKRQGFFAVNIDRMNKILSAANVVQQNINQLYKEK